MEKAVNITLTVSEVNQLINILATAPISWQTANPFLVKLTNVMQVLEGKRADPPPADGANGAPRDAAAANGAEQPPPPPAPPDEDVSSRRRRG